MIDGVARTLAPNGVATMLPMSIIPPAALAMVIIFKENFKSNELAP